MGVISDFAGRFAAFIPRPNPHGGDVMHASHIDSMQSRLAKVAPRAALSDLAQHGFGDLGGSWRSPAYLMNGVNASREVPNGDGTTARQTISIDVEGQCKVEIRDKGVWQRTLSPEEATDVKAEDWAALGSCLRRALLVGVGR